MQIPIDISIKSHTSHNEADQCGVNHHELNRVGLCSCPTWARDLKRHEMHEMYNNKTGEFLPNVKNPNSTACINASIASSSSVHGARWGGTQTGPRDNFPPAPIGHSRGKKARKKSNSGHPVSSAGNERPQTPTRYIPWGSP